ncbi:MAG TPA: DUF222 domain-containing protein [Acidimicrobiia bacterium]
MSGATIFEQLDGVNDVLASIAEDFDGDLFTGKQAQRIVCAAADIERFAVALKALAMRRVDQTDAWKSDGARSPESWLANKTGTTKSDAHGTVEFGAQLDDLPQVAAAVRKGQLSPGKAKMIAGAASKDPDSEAGLVALGKTGSMTALKNECVAARQRGVGEDATARIHARRSHRSWIDEEGAFRYQGVMPVEMGAKFKAALDGFTDQVFQDARRAGVREPYEAYAADAVIRMAEAATTNTTPHGDDDGPTPAAPKYTASRVHLVIHVDAAAWERGYTCPGETCEVAGVGPIDVASAKRMCGDAIVDIVVSKGVDVRTLAHAGRTVTKAQYAALIAEGYECNVEGCGNTRNLEIDHLGNGWAVDHHTCNGELAFKCGHCHDLKSHKHWTDGPCLPNGKRKLNPPASRPPPDDG